MGQRRRERAWCGKRKVVQPEPGAEWEVERIEGGKVDGNK